uniref:Uncharacterized protein n=1 Tax=Chromera velia CCMP2878 TaxID=1169474 RepID=A0A0G4HUY2_9ALVE|eukprot:Cvel_1389.t1-p1 / transcript=Cvel_1389.t1 / gene=Cvel_1389 / organism=Chromera_velia_CCMP2878 / gene_product=hypothetical protein / transcript_product=hypothetical protein / location=Cvel_scaffold48:67595-75196(-) / protein_length=1478 / sequence_SO=supercontig / SO=protein_coding / is_pseudo=false
MAGNALNSPDEVILLCPYVSREVRVWWRPSSSNDSTKDVHTMAWWPARVERIMCERELQAQGQTPQGGHKSGGVVPPLSVDSGGKKGEMGVAAEETGDVQMGGTESEPRPGEEASGSSLRALGGEAVTVRPRTRFSSQVGLTLRVRYSNEEVEDVPWEDVEPWKLPVDFKSKDALGPLQPGEFVEILMDETEDLHLLFGMVVDVDNKKKNVYVSLPFHNEETACFPQSKCRRARVFDRVTLDWDYFRPEQHWRAGHIQSPLQLLRNGVKQYRKTKKDIDAKLKSVWISQHSLTVTTPLLLRSLLKHPEAVRPPGAPLIPPSPFLLEGEEEAEARAALSSSSSIERRGHLSSSADGSQQNYPAGCGGEGVAASVWGNGARCTFKGYLLPSPEEMAAEAARNEREGKDRVQSPAPKRRRQQQIGGAEGALLDAGDGKTLVLAAVEASSSLSLSPPPSPARKFITSRQKRDAAEALAALSTSCFIPILAPSASLSSSFAAPAASAIAELCDTKPSSAEPAGGGMERHPPKALKSLLESLEIVSRLPPGVWGEGKERSESGAIEDVKNMGGNGFLSFPSASAVSSSPSASSSSSSSYNDQAAERRAAVASVVRQLQGGVSRGPDEAFLVPHDDAGGEEKETKGKGKGELSAESVLQKVFSMSGEGGPLRSPVVTATACEVTAEGEPVGNRAVRWPGPPPLSLPDTHTHGGIVSQGHPSDGGRASLVARLAEDPFLPFPLFADTARAPLDDAGLPGLSLCDFARARPESGVLASSAFAPTLFSDDMPRGATRLDAGALELRRLCDFSRAMRVLSRSRTRTTPPFASSAAYAHTGGGGEEPQSANTTGDPPDDPILSTWDVRLTPEYAIVQDAHIHQANKAAAAADTVAAAAAAARQVAQAKSEGAEGGLPPSGLTVTLRGRRQQLADGSGGSLMPSASPSAAVSASVSGSTIQQQFNRPPAHPHRQRPSRIQSADTTEKGEKGRGRGAWVKEEEEYPVVPGGGAGALLPLSGPSLIPIDGETAAGAGGQPVPLQGLSVSAGAGPLGALHRPPAGPPPLRFPGGAGKSLSPQEVRKAAALEHIRKFQQQPQAQAGGVRGGGGGASGAPRRVSPRHSQQSQSPGFPLGPTSASSSSSSSSSSNGFIHPQAQSVGVGGRIDGGVNGGPAGGSVNAAAALADNPLIRPSPVGADEERASPDRSREGVGGPLSLSFSHEEPEAEDGQGPLIEDPPPQTDPSQLNNHQPPGPMNAHRLPSGPPTGAVEGAGAPPGPAAPRPSRSMRSRGPAQLPEVVPKELNQEPRYKRGRQPVRPRQHAPPQQSQTQTQTQLQQVASSSLEEQQDSISRFPSQAASEQAEGGGFAESIQNSVEPTNNHQQQEQVLSPQAERVEMYDGPEKQIPHHPHTRKIDEHQRAQTELASLAQRQNSPTAPQATRPSRSLSLTLDQIPDGAEAVGDAAAAAAAGGGSRRVSPRRAQAKEAATGAP